MHASQACLGLLPKREGNWRRGEFPSVWTVASHWGGAMDGSWDGSCKNSESLQEAEPF